MLILIIFGGLLASFLFAVTSMEGIRFLFRRSRCETCSHTLSWFELIPVFSFLFLKGRCLNCNETISLSYLVTEVMTVALFILPLFFEIGLYELTLYYLAVLILVPLSVYDYEHMKIPNHMTLLFLFTGLFLTHLNYFEPFYDILIILMLHIVYFLFNESIGYGDIKLFTVLTLITPVSFFLYTVLFTYLIGGAFIVFIQMIKSRTIKKVPLVPFITNAVVIVFFLYEEINMIYYGGFL